MEKKVVDNEGFIQDFEKEESLWNVYKTIYKDRNERKAALERLASKYGLSGMLFLGQNLWFIKNFVLLQ